MVLLQEMRVIASSNTFVGNCGLFRYISLKLLVIAIICFDNVIYSRDIIHITRNKGTVVNHTREE